MELAEFIVDQVGVHTERLVREEKLEPLAAAQKALGLVYLQLNGEKHLSDVERWTLRALRDLGERRPGRSFLRGDVQAEISRQRLDGLHDIDRAPVTWYRTLLSLEKRLLAHRPGGPGTKYWRATPRIMPEEPDGGLTIGIRQGVMERALV